MVEFPTCTTHRRSLLGTAASLPGTGGWFLHLGSEIETEPEARMKLANIPSAKLEKFGDQLCGTGRSSLFDLQVIDRL